MTDTFTIVTAEAAAPDPAKHVNYVQGMVLGVDDFTQEFAYLSGRDQWLAREALGYGVLRGLRVRVEPGGADGPRVYVSSGVALTARGELVCVPDDQCAYLNPWLSANQARVPASTPATLYVRLCYSSCATDSQPIPGEPCRDDDDLMAPSRIKDWYRLELTTDPPAQVEEDGLRAFVAWLRAVRKSIGLSPVEALSLEDFVAAVRAAWLPAGEGEGSPPLAPPYRLAEELLIPGYDADSYLRAALRVWTNEVRPALSAQGQACARPPADGCILLAALDLELTNDRRQVLEVLEVREAEAPFLLHLRMLQEWLLSGENEALPAESVRAEQAYGLAADVGLAHEYARADHTLSLIHI
ncbi:MAG: hypothetical protein N2378_10920, partial [Chloroflexaceae bacterium]|nr:hypothetical protein [Chloroflexaceae bacterium]